MKESRPKFRKISTPIVDHHAYDHITDNADKERDEGTFDWTGDKPVRE